MRSSILPGWFGSLVLACLATACSASSDDSASDAGADAAAEVGGGSPCHDDGECGAGSVCELTGPACDAPRCVEGCHSGVDCGDESVCVRVECTTCPCPGRCALLSAGSVCRDDSDCPAGSVCELGGADCDTPVCVPGCRTGRDCDEGEACASVECVTCPCPDHCVALGGESECLSDADCGEGEVCELGGPDCSTPVCVAGCHNRSDCGGGAACVPVTCVTCPCPAQCLDVGGDGACSDDSDCAEGEVCELGLPDCSTPVCVRGCHSRADCGEAQVCQEVRCVTCPCPGQCEDLAPDGECGSDADCNAGEVCEPGGPDCRTPVCVPGCHSRADCGEGQACREVRCLTCPCPGHCEDLATDGECRSDADCGAGQVCEPGGPGCTTPVCVSGCRENPDCGDGQTCQEVVCITCPCPPICSSP